MFVKIKNILAKSISRLGIENQINRIKICGISKEIIQKNFFKKSGKINFNVKNFKNGILEVICENPVFANELRLRNNLIINEINQKLDNGLPKIEHIKSKLY